MKCPRCQRRLREDAQACLCGWTVGASSQPAGKRHHDCEAYGCPIPGTISPNLNGTGPWKCFVHDRLNQHELQQVTAAIRQRAWMLDFLRWLYGVATVDWTRERIDVLKVRLASKGREDLYPDGSLELRSRAIYTRRIEEVLVAEVRAEAKARADAQPRDTVLADVPDFSRASDLVDVA